MRIFRALAVALPVFFASSIALANGRYPIAGQIVEDPDDSQHLIVRATYGVMITNDRGKTWGWVCEPSIGFLMQEDPMMGVAHGGNILAAIFEGLSVSSDNGCDWSFYSPLKNKYVVDLAIDKVDPSNGVLIVSNNAGANKFVTQMWQTSDGASTWSQAGVNLPDTFIGITLDSAPSDPETVYVSGRLGPPKFQGVLEKTTDRGASWQAVDIPKSNNVNLPYIGAIAPDDPGRVYVRLNGDSSDTLVVTKDGGTNWKEVFHAKGMLLGFALSPDGTELAIGGDKDGIYLANTTDLAFKKVSPVHARCLTWTEQGLYACGDEFVDGFEVGLSKDQGKTFTDLFHLQTLCNVLSCPEGSETATKCPDLIGATELAIMADCGTGGGGGHGGAPSTSSASASSGGGGGTASGGCGCATEGDGQSGAAFSIALFGLALLRRAKLLRPSQAGRPLVG